MTIVKTKIDDRYIQLNDATENVVVEFIDIQKHKLLDSIKTIVFSESFIFTQNIDYAQKVKEINDTDAVTFLQNSLKSYSDVSISRFCDYVPMQCHLFMVTQVYKNLHEFVDFQKMATYLVDDESIAKHRTETETSLNRFTNALHVLSKLKN